MVDDLLEKNLRVLREANPSLAARVAQSGDDESYRLIAAENGCPTMLASVGGRRVLLHSRYNPVRVALA